jgi:hypothetical protein
MSETMSLGLAQLHKQVLLSVVVVDVAPVMVHQTESIWAVFNLRSTCIACFL